MTNVLTEIRNNIAILTLNDPETYNALGADMVKGITEAFDKVLANSAVKVIVLTANGNGFCSGAMLSEEGMVNAENTIGDSIRKELNPLLLKIRSASVPVVTAVNGVAAGAGVGLALIADIVVAAKTAKFVLSFVRIGAVLDAGTSLVLQQLLGPARARAMALLGKPVNAETAQEWGLIWKVCDDSPLLDALAIAEDLAKGPKKSIAVIKQQIESAWAAPLPKALESEAVLQVEAFNGAELKEGVASFREKREPNFS